MVQVCEFKPSDVLGNLNQFELKNAPDRIFYQGDLSLLQQGGRVSVVGSRKPTREGILRAQKVSRELVAHGLIVVSGLAEGIDTVAHTIAIAQGGRTIAVLGTALDNPYPASNKGLLEEIARDHLVVSQFPFKSPFQTKNFPIRNRTMALISHATIIIEASEKSGTRHQGWEALRLGRLLYILENVANDPSLSWPKEMMSYGAQILNQDNLKSVIEELPKVYRSDEDPFDF